jgi:membrane-associated phospholipid phosphatase
MVEQETEEAEAKDSKLEKLKSNVPFDYHSSRFFSLVFLVVYIVAITIFCLEYKIIPGPEFLVLGILFIAAYNKQTYRALKDWLPFITVFLSYEVMYSFVGTVSKNNLHTGPALIDTHLFGQIPSIILQQNLRLPILDYMGAFFYSIYFFVPTIFAYIVWRKSPTNYWKYTVAFGVLTYAALITFLFYPVAPPWIEFNSVWNPSYAGPQVIRVLTGSVDPSLGLPVYKTLFDFLSPNNYAAFPSMHSAIPWLVFLFAFRIWKWKSLPVLAIPVGTWFSAMYLGEHYFTDVVAGIIYATLAYLAVVKLLPYMSSKIHYLQKHVPIEK